MQLSLVNNLFLYNIDVWQTGILALALTHGGRYTSYGALPGG
jgi:hypothetical protein